MRMECGIGRALARRCRHTAVIRFAAVNFFSSALAAAHLGTYSIGLAIEDQAVSDQDIHVKKDTKHRGII